jgi:hypothetical protein
MTSFSRQRYRTSAELRAKINWNPYDLTIVSFDAHFDKTQRGRKTPAEILRVGR